MMISLFPEVGSPSERSYWEVPMTDMTGSIKFMIEDSNDLYLWEGGCVTAPRYKTITVTLD